MKSTPLAVKATAPKQTASVTGPDKVRLEAATESLELSQERLRDRAYTSTQVMEEILERDKRSYSFRHWGINE